VCRGAQQTKQSDGEWLKQGSDGKQMFNILGIDIGTLTEISISIIIIIIIIIIKGRKCAANHNCVLNDLVYITCYYILTCANYSYDLLSIFLSYTVPITTGCLT
jgi:hypothetical protein